MWHAQEHYNSYTQPLINLVSAHILGRVRFCLKFYIILCIFFYKIKTKEHPNLHDTTFLVLFRVYVGENSKTFHDLIEEFKDFSTRTFQGFTLKFKDFSKTVRTLDTTFKVEENSRTFQATIEFKDFSMTPPKIQALFETMRTLVLEKKKEKGLLVRY